MQKKLGSFVKVMKAIRIWVVNHRNVSLFWEHTEKKRKKEKLNERLEEQELAQM